MALLASMRSAPFGSALDEQLLEVWEDFKRAYFPSGVRNPDFGKPGSHAHKEQVTVEYAIRQWPEIGRQIKAKWHDFLSKREQDLEGEHEPKVVNVEQPGWKQIRGQQGGNPGGTYQDPKGDHWYVKTPQDEKRVRDEVLAAKLYEEVGVKMPEMHFAIRDGKPSIASKMIPGVRLDADALRRGTVKGVGEGMAADAWLGNYDAVGLVYDNMLVDEENNAVRIDPGGALQYRATGPRKEEKGYKSWGPRIHEFEHFLDPQHRDGKVYGNVPGHQIQEGIDRILATPEDRIRQLVQKYGPRDAAENDKMIETLLARRKHLEEMAPQLAARLGRVASIQFAYRLL